MVWNSNETCDITATRVIKTSLLPLEITRVSVWREPVLTCPLLQMSSSDPVRLKMFRLTVAPRSAPGSTPPVGPSTRPLTPTGPRLSSRGGSRGLGQTVIRAPQVVRVTAGCQSSPGGRAVARVGAGDWIYAISGLRFEREHKENSLKAKYIHYVNCLLQEIPVWFCHISNKSRSQSFN